jgi:hypothetical protein
VWWHHEQVKRALIVVLLLFAAVSGFAKERDLKRELISELLHVIDAKGLTQASFDAVFATLRGLNEQPRVNDLPEEYRAQFEEQEKAEQEKLKRFRERLFTRMDYQKYAEEAYVPLFDEHFTADELKELIAFFKTKPGQKLVTIMPSIGVGGLAQGKSLLMKATEETSQEIDKEEASKTPWRATMADMRTIATALEARATDTNNYPDASFEDLPGLLSPTYIREVPKVDGWGNSFAYVGNGEHYRIISAGADRRFEWSSRQIATAGLEQRQTDNPDADIVYQDGTFMQYPAESQPQN